MAISNEVADNFPQHLVDNRPISAISGGNALTVPVAGQTIALTIPIPIIVSVICGSPSSD